MIWDDPWVVVAAGGTTLPPPSTPLLPDRTFLCLRESEMTDTLLAEWITLIGTKWSVCNLRRRLHEAWIPCLFRSGTLVATCVLRSRVQDPSSGQERPTWILETLRAAPGFCTPLLRAVIPWLFHHDGPFTLAYTWELSWPGLVAAWCRSWITASSILQYGWIFRSTTGCSFCSGPRGGRYVMPTLYGTDSGTAVVSDSGLADGWGYVSVSRGKPSWLQICQKGDWHSLWMRSATSPGDGWTWSGEFVVVGVLNPIYPIRSHWITAEISCAH